MYRGLGIFPSHTVYVQGYSSDIFKSQERPECHSLYLRRGARNFSKSRGLWRHGEGGGSILDFEDLGGRRYINT